MQTTFVFVTPRRWLERDAWIVQKRGEGKWKGMLAFDAKSATRSCVAECFRIYIRGGICEMLIPGSTSSLMAA